MAVLLELKGMCKYFPGVCANEDVNLSIEEGEIHALLGENGAGKTTLMNCIYGLYTPEKGEIIWKGKKVVIKSIKDAIDLGIGMVHQHFMLVHNMTVLENIMLGMPSRKGLFLDKQHVANALNELMVEYGLHVDLQSEIWQLPVGVQQKVEIIKILFRQAKLLILDEPTAVLTPDEVESFFAMLRVLKKQGHSVIIITHKLDEVIQIADRVTVLRGGKVIQTLACSDTDKKKLASMMIGKEFIANNQRAKVDSGETVLDIEKLRCMNDKGLEALHAISFKIAAGEILGIAGVSGNGQSELAEVIAGMRKLTGGHIRVCGKDVSNLPPKKLYDQGMAHIPEDRHKVGLIMDFSIKENSIMGIFEHEPFAHGIRVDQAAITEHAKKIAEKYDVRTPNNDVFAKLLSGGNQQKLILGRELSKNPKLLIAVQPTRGLDIGATEFVQDQIEAEKQQGAAIMYISTELEEIFKMSDKIAVMFAGKLYGPYPAESMNIETVGAMMAGTWKEGNEDENEK